MEDRESTCRRCLKPYKRSHNPDTACRFHPQLFVCRKHDDQKRYAARPSAPCTAGSLPFLAVLEERVQRHPAFPLSQCVALYPWLGVGWCGRYYELKEGDPEYAAQFYGLLRS